MRKKLWIAGYFALVVAALAVIGTKVVQIDPFFHFHKPIIESYFYPLNNERSQNDGIIKNFDYDGMITGTSMTQNFKTSEAEEIFGGKFIKVPFSGSSYKEIRQNIETAASHNKKLKLVITGLDQSHFFYDKDWMRRDLGTYPDYLYDENILNDVQYVFNRDVLFSRVYPMMKENDKPGFRGGITSFDDYSNWMKAYSFGYKSLFPDGVTAAKLPVPEVTPNAVETARASIRQNIVSLAESYPDITFCYFFPPYSAVWWQLVLDAGSLNQQIEGERAVIEEILKCDNIRLFSFNCLFDITTDLNNYKDAIHYGEWINSLILRCIHDGKCLLTKENYREYLEKEARFYSEYDYSKLLEQEDYENDYDAAVLLDADMIGTAP